MKKILTAILIACGVILVGGIIDNSNIFGDNAQPIIITSVAMIAGMVMGAFMVYDFQDAKKAKKTKMESMK